MILIAPKRTVTKPLAPSVAIEAWYYKQLQCLLAAMASSMELHIAAAWKSETPDIGMASDASSPVVLKRAISKWSKNWLSKFDDMATEVARRFADKTQRHSVTAMQSIMKDAGFTVRFTVTQAAKDAYRAVLAQNVSLIKNLPRTYVNGIENATWESVMKGRDVAGLQTALREQYDIGLRRSALIARDQNRKATALIENVRRDELGITHAVWLHSHAVKTPRPSHKAFSGKVYELKKGAYLDGKWVWPGTEINCRCLSRSIISGVNDAQIQRIMAREAARRA